MVRRHVAPRQAVPLHPQAAAFAAHYGFEIDVLAAPTVSSTAVSAGQDIVTWPAGDDETVTEAFVRLTMPADIAGVPALSVPAGHDRAGLPIGLQLVARPSGEQTLVRVGTAYERSRPARTLAPAP